MQLHLKRSKSRNQGAILVIALILIVVLSALGIAAISNAVSARHAGESFSKYTAAQIKAISMAGYAQRILGTFRDGIYFGPGSCDSTATCNVVDNSFPMNGRPLLPWDSGTGISGSSAHTNAWWNSHGFAYEAAFAGSGNARVVVAQLGNNPSSPYQHTYKITGYASDPSTNSVKATFNTFHVWRGYAADPGDGTCSGGCFYGQCCAGSGICSTDQTTCESSTATYVPPGWSCTNYFGTGLGFGGSVCANPILPPS